MRSRIIFHNVASEYNSTFVFLMLCLQFGILRMTEVHQWSEVYFSTLIPCFSDHLIFVSDFCQLPCRYFLEFFSFFLHCCFWIWYFHCLRNGNRWMSAPICSDSMNSSLFLQCDLQDSCEEILPCASSSVFVLCSSTVRQVSLYISRWSLQDIAAGIGTSNFLRAFFTVPLNSIIRNNEVNTSQPSGVVELWFLDSPLLLFFAFRRFRHIFPNLWPRSVWPGGRLFSCQSHPGPCISIRWFFAQKSEPCETCPSIWQFSNHPSRPNFLKNDKKREKKGPPGERGGEGRGEGGEGANPNPELVTSLGGGRGNYLPKPKPLPLFIFLFLFI